MGKTRSRNRSLVFSTSSIPWSRYLATAFGGEGDFLCIAFTFKSVEVKPIFAGDIMVALYHNLGEEYIGSKGSIGDAGQEAEITCLVFEFELELIAHFVCYCRSAIATCTEVFSIIRLFLCLLGSNIYI